MATKKNPDLANIKAFRAAHSTNTVPENQQSEAYLVPKIVKDMGQLIGLWSDAIHANWQDTTFNLELVDAYRELAATTSVLLDFYSVQEISEEAVVSVGHRLAATVLPLVSLHARVDHLYRSYAQDEAEHVRDDAQKLWAALEFRAESVTGQSFAQVLSELI